ncbi:hypothetical protein [Psychromonas hadalis]|uniref:hypothetical protein n=1 Tax=Psychromonas hadalis TaxID=211669 RepID=UPI0003B3A8CB|nr:hypothetical protein [Psychromonas hadalis]
MGIYDAFTDTGLHWDSVHYMKLAVEGYTREGPDRFLLLKMGGVLLEMHKVIR